MKRNTVVFLLALCPLIPASAHFSYSIILSLALLFYFFTGLFFRFLLSKINPGPSSFYLELVALAGSATLFYQIISVLFPVLAVSLDIYIFITAFSYVLLLSIDYHAVSGFSFLPVFKFIPLLLFFSICREIAGQGTLTFPVLNGVFEIVIFPNFNAWGSAFWNTTAGAFILLGFLTWLFKIATRRYASRHRNTQ